MKLIQTTTAKVSHNINITDEELNLFRCLLGKTCVRGVRAPGASDTANNLYSLYDQVAMIVVNQNNILDSNSPIIYISEQFGPQRCTTN